MGQLTPEESKMVDQVLATLVLARGRHVPEYLASLSPAQRYLVIEALSNFTDVPMDNSMKVALFSFPELVTDLINSNSLLGAGFDELGRRAQETIDQWDKEKVQSETERLRYRLNPGKNAKYN